MRQHKTTTGPILSRRRAGLLGLLGLLISLALVFASSAASTATPPRSAPAVTAVAASAVDSGNHSAAKPTIVFVHGAFADASGFSDEIAALQRKGFTVYAPANPLRSLTTDSDYIRTFLSTIPGPIVLVGHSYGGAVITNAATGNPNVKALVYIAAYALDQNETAGAANALGGGTALLGDHLVVRPLPGSSDFDGYVDPVWFRRVFAADVPARTAAVMAASQRPLALSAFGEPSGVPAWATIPSWYLVAHDDHAIPPAAERYMAKRAGSHTIEIRSSHVAMISHPRVVTALILTAVASTRG